MNEKPVPSNAQDRETWLIGGLAHELRSPLNSIIGFSSLLEAQLSDSLSEKHRGYLKNIASSGRDLLALIDLVVEVALLEGGARLPRTESVDLADVADRCVQLTKERALKRGVAVRPAPGNARGRALTTDPIRLLWALIQLVDHAVDSLEAEGEVRFERPSDLPEGADGLRIIATPKEPRLPAGAAGAAAAHDRRMNEADRMIRALGGSLGRDEGGQGGGIIYEITLRERSDAAREEDSVEHERENTDRR